jgi:hypothetical protein
VTSGWKKAGGRLKSARKKFGRECIQGQHLSNTSFKNKSTSSNRRNYEFRIRPWTKESVRSNVSKIAVDTTSKDLDQYKLAKFRQVPQPALPLQVFSERTEKHQNLVELRNLVSARKRGWAIELAESLTFYSKFPSIHQRIAYRLRRGHVDGKFTSCG